jgi:uncharacterized membrane protein YkoI
MQVFTKSLLKPALSSLLIAMVFIAPAALAKKDLFGNDPAGKYSAPAQELINKQTPPAEETDVNEPLPTPSADDQTAENQSARAKSADPTLLQKLTQTLKSPIESFKKSFPGKDSEKKHATVAPQQTPDIQAEVVANTEVAVETVAPPAISPTEAAQRAQLHAEGQVMNVRTFQEDDKTLYGVKLLQKNGRMKTVNVDANSGEIVE